MSINGVTSSTSSIASSTSTATPSTSTSSAVAGSTSTGSVGAARPVVDSAVIGGEAQVINRLFRGDAKLATEVFYTARNHPGSGLGASFLTRQDRVMVASLYDQAAEQGWDLADVDMLAHRLASFRSAEGLRGDHVGISWDENRKIKDYSLSPQNEAKALDILGSKAINNSALPSEFVRFMLDPGFSGDMNPNVDFLGKVVFATSPDGNAANPNAVIPPRPAERLAAAIAGGAPIHKPPIPDDSESSPLELFEKYSERVSAFAPYLDESTQGMLGSMWAEAAQKHGPDSEQMRKVDVLARGLAISAMNARLFEGLGDRDENKTTGLGATAKPSDIWTTFTKGTGFDAKA